MKHPALTRVLAIVLAILCLTMGMAGWLGLRRAEDFRAWFHELLRDVGLKTSIADFDLPDFDAGVLADGVNLERLGNNPKPLGRDELMALFG